MEPKSILKTPGLFRLVSDLAQYDLVSSAVKEQSKEKKNVQWDVTQSSNVMLEYSSGDDSEETVEMCWKRNIVHKTYSEIQDEYEGKVDLKGKHKICRSDIIKKLCVKRLISSYDVKKLLIQFCNPKLQKTKKSWNLFLNSNFKKKDIDLVTRELTLPTTGSVCIIPKDHELGQSTKRSRMEKIEKGWCHVRASSILGGGANARLFMTGTKFIITNSDLAKKIKDNCSVGSIIKNDNDTYLFFIDDSERDTIIGICYDDAVKEVTMWLRWNEWIKFEEFVLANTDIDTNPGEFDYVRGGYWRAVNGKEDRFDEKYEKTLVVDSLLQRAKKNAGKLSAEIDDS